VANAIKIFGKMKVIIFYLVLALSLDSLKAAQFEKTDFYSRFSSFSYIELDSISNLIQDKEVKDIISRNLIFVAFNYYFQKEKNHIKGNKTFEKSVQHVYLSRRELPSWAQNYRDPLQWPEEAGEPALMVPNPGAPEDRASYLQLVKGFIDFLEGAE
jgi:hypothetical protein